MVEEGTRGEREAQAEAVEAAAAGRAVVVAAAAAGVRGCGDGGVAADARQCAEPLLSRGLGKVRLVLARVAAEIPAAHVRAVGSVGVRSVDVSGLRTVARGLAGEWGRALITRATTEGAARARGRVTA